MNDLAKIYNAGFEDGFESNVFRDEFSDNQASFVYRKGYEAGRKAANAFDFWTLVD